MSDKIALLTFLNEVESDITAEVQPTAGIPADFRETAFTKMLAPAAILLLALPTTFT